MKFNISLRKLRVKEKKRGDFKKFIRRVYISVYHLTPRWYKESIQKLIEYADVHVTPEDWISFTILFSIGLGFATMFDLWAVFSVKFSLAVIIGITTTILSLLFFYTLLSYTADRRAARAEEVFSDVLALMAANIRAGMTVEEALWSAPRPEFGPLAKEIGKVADKVIEGVDLDEALMEIPRRVESDIIQRTVALLAEGIRAGGKVAPLLEGISDEIRVLRDIKREVNARISFYRLSLIFVAAFGAPLLFSLSLGFMNVAHNMLSQMNVDVSELNVQGMPLQMGFALGSKFIDLDALRMFAITCIAITCFFASLLIGTIQEGSAKRGLRYTPILIAISLIIFNIALSFTMRIYESMI